jgi:hypothetical protein
MGKISPLPSLPKTAFPWYLPMVGPSDLCALNPGMFISNLLSLVMSRPWPVRLTSLGALSAGCYDDAPWTLNESLGNIRGAPRLPRGFPPGSGSKTPPRPTNPPPAEVFKSGKNFMGIQKW